MRRPGGACVGAADRSHAKRQRSPRLACRWLGLARRRPAYNTPEARPPPLALLLTKGPDPPLSKGPPYPRIPRARPPRWAKAPQPVGAHTPKGALDLT